MNSKNSNHHSDPNTHSGPATADLIRYRVVQYPERLDEVLALRRAAYGAAQKHGPDDAESAEGDGADPRNLRSSTVIAELEGQIIGSLRLAPPLPGPLLHHTCEFAEPVKGLPPRTEFIEASWACVHPAHQGKGLFWSISAYMVLVAKQLGKPYLVGGTDADMWRNWKRCGFRKTGSTYLGAISRNRYWVMLLNVDEVLAGHNIAPEFARVLLPLSGTAAQTTPSLSSNSLQSR